MLSSKPAQMPEYSAPLIQIKAKVTQKKISYLMDSFICSEIKAQKNDWVNVTFTAPDTPWLGEILLSLSIFLTFNLSMINIKITFIN